MSADNPRVGVATELVDELKAALVAAETAAAGAVTAAPAAPAAFKVGQIVATPKGVAAVLSVLESDGEALYRLGHFVSVNDSHLSAAELGASLL
jgi:hypothetical protein